MDIATLTGGRLMSEEVGMTLERAEMGSAGLSDKIVVQKEDTLFLDGLWGKIQIKEPIEQFHKIRLWQGEAGKRLAKLVGGVGGRSFRGEGSSHRCSQSRQSHPGRHCVGAAAHCCTPRVGFLN